MNGWSFTKLNIVCWFILYVLRHI